MNKKIFLAQKYSIQESSLASDCAIWLGIDDADPKIMSSTAIAMGLKERNFTEADNGFTPYEIPKDVLLTTRMHLNQQMAKDLVEILNKFIETGDL